MKITRLLTVIAAGAFSFFLTARAASNEAPVANPGDKVYTQCGLFYEKKIHRTTNYQKGIFIPVNTEVTVVKSAGKEIVVNLPEGVELKIVNVENFSGENITGILNRTFGKSKVDLSKFSKLEQEHIGEGKVAPGMSKDAVIVAIGYPPKHETPSLTVNSWRYWRNRFNTFMVRFKDGKVTEVQD